MRPQYSQKEDKYEEEIKVLTDKLKEVSQHFVELLWNFYDLNVDSLVTWIEYADYTYFLH